VRFQRHHVADIIGNRLLVLLLHVLVVLIPYGSLFLPYECRFARALRTSYAIPAIAVVEASAALIGGVLLDRDVNCRSST
jgi:hypothetical protein